MGTSEQVWAGILGAVSVVLVAAIAGWRRSWLVAAVAVMLLAGLGLSSCRAWANSEGPVAELAGRQATATIEARLVNARLVPTKHGPMWLGQANLVQLEAAGQRWRSGAEVRLGSSGELARAWSEVPIGATVRTLVRLSPTEAGDSAAAWMRPRGSPTVLAPPGPLELEVSRVRAGLRAAASGLPSGPRELVPALVLGDSEAMAPALERDFQETGLTHLTAVSGANLTLLLAALLGAAGRLGARGWWLRLIAAIGTGLFVMLCRSEPSVLRAAAMGLVGLAALGSGSERGGRRALAWAVIGLLLVDPWLARSIGFVLSVAASAGIVWWAAAWARQLSWLPNWLAQAIAVPVAAQVATQPFVTALSGEVSMVAVVANLLAAPLVGPATVLGFAAAAVAAIWVLPAIVPAWLAGGFAQGLCWIASAGAALPGASVKWPSSPVGLLVLALCCGAGVVVLPLIWRRKRWMALVVGLLLLALTRPLGPPGWPPANWVVVSCDVGQGDATVVSLGAGRAILVDAGPEPALIDRCLGELGITEIVVLAVTHLHADHIDGVSGAVRGRRVGLLLYSGVQSPESGWRLLRAALAGVPIQQAEPGLVMRAGDSTITALSIRPLPEVNAVAAGDSSEENDSSLVLRIEVAGLRLLVAGDLEEAGQEHALASGADLRADVVLVPHHGSAHQATAFLPAVAPTVALVSVGKGNEYGHPAARTAAAIRGLGVRSYQTDQCGSIAISRGSAAEISVTTQTVPR